MRLGQSTVIYTRPQFQNVARGRSVLRVSETPLIHDPRLPPGWRRTIQRTANMESFVVISDKVGRQFRSREELKNFVTAYGIDGIDPTKVDFSIYGQVM